MSRGGKACVILHSGGEDSLLRNFELESVGKGNSSLCRYAWLEFLGQDPTVQANVEIMHATASLQ